MSRIGKMPIPIPSGVTVSVERQSEGAAHPHVVERGLEEIHRQRADGGLRGIEPAQLRGQSRVRFDVRQKREGHIGRRGILVPVECQR